MSKLTALLGLLLALGIMPATAQRVDQAKVLADSGFRPKPNGFGFPNWGGNQHPHAKLTAEDAAILFGDQVCARRTNGLCVPTPGAKMWIDKMNKSSEGGHCEGMAVLSAAFYTKAESPQTLGAKETFALAPKNEVLMRSISAYFAMQFLEPVSSASKSALQLTLQQLVDRLIESLKAGKDYPTVGFYYSDGGHAVTPYRVDSTGPGLYRVYIYDNNYPGAERYIDFDIPRDQWVYLGAALNPAEAAAPWKGSRGTFEVTMLSARQQPLKCPFCSGPTAPRPASKPATPAPAAKPAPGAPQPGARPPAPPKPGAQKPKSPIKPEPRKPAVAKPKSPAPPAQRPAPRPAQNLQPAVPSDSYTVVTSSRCTQVQAVSKGSKQQVRMGAAGVDNQITGASMSRIRGARGCVVSLPKDQEYDVRLVDDGQPSTRPTTDLVVFGPGKVYEVSDVVIRPNATESFSVEPDNFSYQAGGSQKPTLRVGGAGAGANGYYEVSGFELSEGREFGARETDDGKIAFSNNDPGIDRFDLRAEIVDEEDSEEYEFDDFEVGDNGQALIDIDDEGDLYVDVDSDSDGDYDAIDEDDDNDGMVDEADDESDLGDDESDFGDDESDLGDDESDLGDDESDLGDDESDLGDDESDFGDDESDLGDDESDLGDDESDFGDDEAEDMADDDEADGDDLDDDEGDDDGNEKSMAGGSDDDMDDEDDADDEDSADDGDGEDYADDGDDEDSADDGDDEDSADDGDDEDSADDGDGEDYADDGDDEDYADDGDDEDSSDDGDDEDYADDGDDEDSADDGDGEDYADDGDDEDYADDSDDEDYADDGDDEDSADDGDGEDYADDGDDEDSADDGDGEDYADDGDGEDYADDGGEDEAEDAGAEEDYAEDDGGEDDGGGDEDDSEYER